VVTVTWRPATSTNDINVFGDSTFTIDELNAPIRD
jgi:hypothetical protein